MINQEKLLYFQLFLAISIKISNNFKQLNRNVFNSIADKQCQGAWWSQIYFNNNIMTLKVMNLLVK